MKGGKRRGGWRQQGDVRPSAELAAARRVLAWLGGVDAEKKPEKKGTKPNGFHEKQKKKEREKRKGGKKCKGGNVLCVL